ncbi:MAG TPA: DUF3536 domain-containing protein [Vitreimonas sp.]|nr:DUF3536 domain-containing protein [Vitreimonas sp.]
MTAGARGRLAVHGHFYQPHRVDPFTGRMPEDASAAPFRDWNSRIDAECYRPNAERATYGRMSWDVGPTLAGWLATAAPVSHAGFVAGDRPDGVRRGNGMACSYHHSILPLASADDRRTEIRWAVRDFELRFGRAPEGFWLPETAVDVPTLGMLVDEGIRYTILAPWQAAGPIDTRRPYRVELGGGRSIVVAFYDGGLSGAVSFEPAATADADRFARERVVTRLFGTPFPDGEPGLILIATDGELYGHHQQFRDLFLHRLLAPATSVADRGFDVVELAAVLLEPPDRPMPFARVVERTSWSCHHGVARWISECPCAGDGRWKAPLRAALDRLAGAIDAVTDRCLASLPGAPARVAARDAFVDVVFGAEKPDAFARRCLGREATAADRTLFLDLLDAQRWRLAMFTSDAWYWDDPVRPETRQNLRCAARAARLVDAATGGHVERSLVRDLALLTSPGTGLDGGAIYRRALADVRQPEIA